MLKAWTRRGQLEMIEELALLMRHAEQLASQERATGREDCPATAVKLLVERSRPVLARLKGELGAGASARDTRRDLTSLYTLVARQVAHAEALRHGNPR